MVEAAVANLRAAQAGRVIAVTRQDLELIVVLENCGCQIVINAVADQGMGTSIAAGVLAAPDAAGWLVSLGDMPSIRAATIATVIDSLQRGAQIVVPAMGGKRGHPVGFSARYGAQLQSLQSDAGAREIVKADATLVVEISVDDVGIFADIDTLEDLKR